MTARTLDQVSQTEAMANVASRKTYLRGWTIFVLGLFGVVLFLGFYPFKFYVTGSGTLDPEQKFKVASGYSGLAIVKSVSVDAGQWVEKGSVLAVLHDNELNERIAALETNIAEERSKISGNVAILASHGGTLTTSQKAEKKQATKVSSTNAESMLAELVHLHAIRESLTLRAPVSGYVTAPKTTAGMVGQPFNGETPVFTMADPSQNWFVFLKIPQDKVSMVVAADQSSSANLEAVFYFDGANLEEYHGEVVDRDIVQEQFSENSTSKELLLKISVPKDRLNLSDGKTTNSSQGALVTGHVHIGRKMRAVYYFNKVRAWIRGVTYNF